MTTGDEIGPLALLRELFTSHKRVIVWSPVSPDPDFLAAAQALLHIGAHFGSRVKIRGDKPLSLQVNRRMVRDFSIPYRIIASRDCSGVDGVIVLDYARPIPPALAPSLPVLLHIDHHQPADEFKDLGRQIVDMDIGAVSTLIGEWLIASGQDWCLTILKKCATALYYAIHADTDGLIHAFVRDQAVADYLGPLCSANWLNRHLRVHLNAQQQERLEKGLAAAVEKDGVLLCGLGLLAHTERDLIAVSSDMLIQRKGISLAAVYALIRSPDHLTLDVSLRSRSKKIDLHDLIRRITQDGGARHYKGAFQINMDYFMPLAETAELWRSVESCTWLQIHAALHSDSGRTTRYTAARWLRRMRRFFNG